MRLIVTLLRESVRPEMPPDRRRRNCPETLRQKDRSRRLTLESGRFERPTEGDKVQYPAG